MHLGKARRETFLVERGSLRPSIGTEADRQDSSSWILGGSDGFRESNRLGADRTPNQPCQSQEPHESVTEDGSCETSKEYLPLLPFKPYSWWRTRPQNRCSSNILLPYWIARLLCLERCQLHLAKPPVAWAHVLIITRLYRCFRQLTSHPRLFGPWTPGESHAISEPCH